jgi:geranylgeranyl reductase family protein
MPATQNHRPFAMNPTHHADVIVVGAGPAGSSAAFFLAREGVDVLLVDRATFPREKICGDGIGVRCLEILTEMGLLEWIRERGFNTSRRFLLSSPNRTSAVTDADPASSEEVHTIPRIELDQALAARAVATGARLEEGVRVTGMERPNAERVRVTGRRGDRAVAFEAPLVIAADGGGVSFTRRLGLARKPAEWVAVRTYYQGDRGDPDQLEIHWEPSVLPGYGWVFPLGRGRANVGIGAYSRDVRRLRLDLSALLHRFLAENPHARSRLGDAERISPVRGFPLRADAQGVTPYDDHVLVAGEAAGVVSPLTGEGVGQSLHCGRLAAREAFRALARGDFSAAGLAPYGRAFRHAFGGHHRAARLLRALLSRPWIVDRTVGRARRDPTYARLLYDVIAGVVPPAAALRPGPVLKMLAG